MAILECDTIYGIVGIAGRTDARIRALKDRNEGKNFIALIPDRSWVGRLTDMPLPEALGRYWPGPLTLIFPAKTGGTVALRVPRDAFLRKLIEEIGEPLNSTSVNLQGRPSLNRMAEILPAFEARVDLIVDSGDLENRKPSTIVDLTGRPFRIIRPGALDLSDPAILEDR